MGICGPLFAFKGFNLRFLYETKDLRVEQNEEAVTILGYAAVFNSYSYPMFGAREKIAPGAFTATLIENPDVRALFNHDANYILGRTTAGTLNLEEDEKGLRCEIRLPNTTYARDLKTNIEIGNVTQMSFGFRILDDEWGENENGDLVRTLKRVSLHNGDVSPVTYPAYPATSVEVRSYFEGAPESLTERIYQNKEFRAIESKEKDAARRSEDLGQEAENTATPSQLLELQELELQLQNQEI